MFINKEEFDAWMKRIWSKLEDLENKIGKKEKVRHTVDGELLLDNQDLCIMFNCSKRTLQRFRSSGFLPYKCIDQKLYYLESDVQQFIKAHLKPKRGKEKHNCQNIS